MNTSEVLNRAADLIEERGWCQGVGGWMVEGADPLCLEGAIAAAAGMEGSSHHVNVCPAGRAVREHLGRPIFTDWLVYCMVDGSERSSLWSWNDSRDDASEVIEVLRACAVIEAAREEQDAAFETYAQNVVAR